MPTVKCPDCGHTEQSEDASMTCPECEGTMTAPKKKQKAKATAEDEPEPRAKKKPPRDEDETPKPKLKTKRRGELRDGAAAERAGLEPGFDDEELMAQVTEELESGEVLHYACRPARKLAQLQAALYAVTAAIFTIIPALIGISILRKDKGGEVLMGLIPLAVAVGAGAAVVLAPLGRMRQAARGWYAVTSRRAIVFEVPLLFGRGRATTYTPEQVRKMWVRKSFWLKGGGDVVFRTVITVTTEISRRSEKTTRSTTHYGFIGVEDADAVRDVIEWALLSEDRAD